MAPPLFNDSFILINSSPNLKEAVESFMKEDIIGVDTESDSMHSYREKTCLIQISTSGRDYIIDPLSIGDISCLGKLFKSERTEKVFHAGEYDILCLHRDYSFSFNNLFDTMIAAKILKVKKIGLSNILKNEFNVTLKKKYQKADWSRRPLPEDMLNYARTDTRFLIRLRHRYKKELVSRGLFPLAAEDFRTLSRPLPFNPLSLENSFHRAKRKASLNSRQKGILWNLFLFRDKVAKKKDRPHFKVFPASLLLNMAVLMPRDKKRLKTLKSMSNYNMKKYSDTFLKIINKKGDLRYPKEKIRKSKSADYRLKIEKLKKWRSSEAAESSTASEVILPRPLMEEIAEKWAGGRKELKDIMLPRYPFRFSAYGEKIKKILSRACT